MSYDTDAPATVDGLRDALLACPSWVEIFADVPAATAAIHYPEALPADLTAPRPLAVLEIEQGTFRIIIVGEMSTGAIEELGQALRFELMSRYRVAPSGLVITSEPSPTIGGPPTAWAESANDSTASLTLSGPYGLSL